MRLEHAGKKKSYLMAAAGILVGYLFFFTSSLWYPGQNNASEYTPIGQLQKIGETENSVTIENPAARNPAPAHRYLLVIISQ